MKHLAFKTSNANNHFEMTHAGTPMPLFVFVTNENKRSTFKGISHKPHKAGEDCALASTIRQGPKVQSSVEGNKRWARLNIQHGAPTASRHAVQVHTPPATKKVFCTAIQGGRTQSFARSWNHSVTRMISKQGKVKHEHLRRYHWPRDSRKTPNAESNSFNLSNEKWGV